MRVFFVRSVEAGGLGTEEEQAGARQRVRGGGHARWQDEASGADLCAPACAPRYATRRAPGCRFAGRAGRPRPCAPHGGGLRPQVSQSTSKVMK